MAIILEWLVGKTTLLDYNHINNLQVCILAFFLWWVDIQTCPRQHGNLSFHRVQLNGEGLWQRCIWALAASFVAHSRRTANRLDTVINYMPREWTLSGITLHCVPGRCAWQRGLSRARVAHGGQPSVRRTPGQRHCRRFAQLKQKSCTLLISLYRFPGLQGCSLVYLA